MKNLIFFKISILILSSILLFSCGSKRNNTKKEEKTENVKHTNIDKDYEIAKAQKAKFTKAYNKLDIKTIEDLCYIKTRPLMKSFINEHFEKYGTVTESEFLKQIQNKDGVTLIYKNTYEKYPSRSLYVKYTYFRNNEKIELGGFDYNENKDFLFGFDEYLKNIENTMSKFYADLKAEKPENVVQFFDNEKIILTEKKQAFLNILSKRKKAYGKIQKTQLYQYKMINEDGFAGFYIVYECLSDKKELFLEEFWLIKRGDNFKLYDYAYKPKPKQEN